MAVGITCIAKPNPAKKYEMTNRGKGGAGACMIHETSWEICPNECEQPNELPEVSFLTKHDNLSKPVVRVNEVNVQHRAADESLDR